MIATTLGTRTPKEVLTLRNPSNDKVAFKVKTTAPKLYCVSPKAGVVSAYESLDVQGKSEVVLLARLIFMPSLYSDDSTQQGRNPIRATI